jgi:hypothetical protein
MSLVISNTTFSGSLVGTTGRLKVFMIDSVPLRAGGSVTSEFNVFEPPSEGLQTNIVIQGEDSAPPDGSLADSTREAPAWTGLMEGALQADWEVVDREFRQFLSGLGRLADDTDGSGSGRLWPLGIGVAAAVIVAQQAASRRPGLFRNSIHGVLRVSARHTIPAGPWPLSAR